jgi:hypothetical protein
MELKKLTFIWVLLSGIALAGVWSEPQLIGQDAGYWLTVDTYGVCWATGGPTFYKYNEGTSSWQSIGKIPSSVWGGSIPIGCFDKGNTLWVFNGNYDQIFYARYDGANWSGVDTVPAFPEANSPCLVTRDSTGGIWFNWVHYSYEVACNSYKNGAWGEPLLIPDTVSGQDCGFQVSTDALGRVWFGWLNCWDDIYLECRYIDNYVWSEQMSLRKGNSKSIGIGNIDFAPDMDDGIWASWVVSKHEEGDSNLIETRHYANSKWNKIDTIPDAGIFSYSGYPPEPKIAVDRYNRVWAVWRQALVPKDAYCDIYYSFNSGTGWSKPQPVNTNPAVDMLPDIAVDGAGRVWCVWVSNRGDSSGVWA